MSVAHLQEGALLPPLLEALLEVEDEDGERKEEEDSGGEEGHVH